MGSVSGRRCWQWCYTQRKVCLTGSRTGKARYAASLPGNRQGSEAEMEQGKCKVEGGIWSSSPDPHDGPLIGGLGSLERVGRHVWERAQQPRQPVLR